MLNGKVIVLSGFAHGGTNLAWNLLQSHPDIVAPLYETGEIFRRSTVLRVLSSGSVGSSWLGRSKVIDFLLYRRKMESMGHVDNRYRSQGILYKKRQMANAALCLKSVNADIRITEFLLKVYPNLHFIFLARDGYSLCDGYVRRGQPADGAGRLYGWLGGEVERLSSLIPRSRIVRFEDLVHRPFDIAKELYEFVGVHPVELESVRLKQKRVLNSSGEHKVRAGEEHRKYWVSRQTIATVIDREIDQRQAARLSEKDVEGFNRYAKAAMDYFGYEQRCPDLSGTASPCL